jgi:2-polyprenyl-3-methyl-5-hydroxy-6-metoxy-1,4-benzoquinol methylase
MLNRIPAKGPVEHLNRTKKARMIEAILQGHRWTAFENKRILDVGCGNGRISRYFIDQGHVVAGVDVADKRKENVQFHLVTGTHLPFDDDSFDVVLSNHVIEHLKELHPVLRKDGMCYLATPNKLTD